MVLIATAMISLAFLGYLIMQTTKPPLAVLFSQLEASDAGQIVDRLESMGIPYELRGNGTQIFVPGDRVARIRMDLAQAGIPGTGSLGYELFDKADILGTSSSIMDINFVRAMEGEIAKSIRSIQGVSSARVHLVIPKKEIFSKDYTPPTASIVLKMNHGRLSQGQVLGIQHLVASAVSGLSAEKITIVDDKGSLLARQSDSNGFAMGNNQEMRSAYEQKLAQITEGLLEKTLGPGKARVEVNAEMDFDRVTINSEEYNPDGQVVRSTSTSGENGSSSEQGNEGTVSVQNALPESEQGGQGGKGTQSSNKNSRNEENTTYEISKTNKTLIKESGGVKKLSVAVLVDGTYGQDGKYQARPKEEIEQLSTLVKTAVGFNTDRGDVVELINLPFAPGEPMEPPATIVDKILSQISLSQIANIAIPGLIGLLTLLLFVKPFVGRVIDQIRESPAGGKTMVNATTDDAQSLTSGPMPMMLTSQGEGKEETMPRTISTAQQIRDMIEEHPEETVNIIRNWMATPSTEVSKS